MSRLAWVGGFACAGVLLAIASCVSDEPAVSGSQTGDDASSGDSAVGNETSTTTNDGATAGPAPTGVTACAGNLQATVFFPAVAGATSYNLYYRGTSEAAPGHQVTGVTSPAKTPATLINGQQAFVSISAVVGGVESNHSQEVSVSPYAFTQPHDVVFAAGGVALVAFDSYSTLADGASPSRTVTGAATTISSPLYGALAVDAPLGLIYLASAMSNSVSIWRDASAITNNVAPNHALSGGTTKLDSPGAVALDRTRNRLYIANSKSAALNSILVWDDACNVHDDTPPTAVLTADATTTLSRPGQMFVDETNDKLYVANQLSYVVFSGASTWTGNTSVAPSLTLVAMADAGTVTGSEGIALDSAHDTLYLGNRDYGPTVGAFLAVKASTVTSGAITPLRAYASNSATTTGYLNTTMNIQIDGNDRMFVLRDTGDPARIERWDSASLRNGTSNPPTLYVELASGSATSFVYLP